MASASAAASRFLLWLGFCPDLLQWTVMWKCESNTPFPPQAISVVVFRHSNDDPN